MHDVVLHIDVRAVQGESVSVAINGDITALLADLQERLRDAVTFFWETRQSQASKQKSSGRSDQGLRSAVTGGAQMDGFINLLADLIVAAGVHEDCVFKKKRIELPGYFRPTKEWDLLVIQSDQLIAAVEVKSQVGPSFGNKFNNRTEEAMGSALDLWTAYREGAFNKVVQPWLGYIFLLEDCEKSRTPVKVREPHFEVFAEFRNASYARRYELFCRKIVRERHYNAASFFLSARELGLKGEYEEPAEDVAFLTFTRSLLGQVISFGKSGTGR